jgi:hypothetical protein
VVVGWCLCSFGYVLIGQFGLEFKLCGESVHKITLLYVAL